MSEQDNNLPVTHIMIPDTQVKPGVPLDHLDWIGNFIVDNYHNKPNVKVIHIGDHWDMPSLSMYDKGTKRMEGRRYQDDLDSGNEGFLRLNQPRIEHNKKLRLQKKAAWKPELEFFEGNHEDRINRAVNFNPQLEGMLGVEKLNIEELGWNRNKFLEVKNIDGIRYAHYFYNPMTGKPFGGQNIETRIKSIGHTFSMGHQQTLMYGLRFTSDGSSQHGLVAGACYLHDEDYKGPQGNAHWRGIVVKHQVRNGSYDPMFVSLDYLCRKYEGLGLEQFMSKKYPNLAL